MDNDYILVEHDHALFAEIRKSKKYDQKKDTLYMKDLGLAWPLNIEFREALKKFNIKNHDIKEKVLLLITDKKKFMLKKIKYGI